MFVQSNSPLLPRLLVCCLAASLAIGATSFASAQTRGASDQDPGFFFRVPEAKDCAFDESRNRLYVTTGKQLIVLDTKDKKTVDTVDLGGGPRACDISADFKALAIAPAAAHYIYYIKLDGFEINQVRFKGDSSETGVYDLCVGKDNSVLFSMGFAGSGGVKLRRFDPRTQKVEVVSGINMDAVVTASPDRRYAAIADGNISSGPLNLYDFQQRKYKQVAELGGFNYELVCGRNAEYFARPQGDGCYLYDKSGGRLSLIGKQPVICAAFHPTANRLYIMEHGAMNIQEYDLTRSAYSNAYALDKPLVIEGNVHTSVVGQFLPVGPDAVQANFQRVRTVNYQTFRSGRLKVSEGGKNLFAVVPTGVYMFALHVPAEATAGGNSQNPRHRVKVIEAQP